MTRQEFAAVLPPPWGSDDALPRDDSRRAPDCLSIPVLVKAASAPEILSATQADHVRDCRWCQRTLALALLPLPSPAPGRRGVPSQTGGRIAAAPASGGRAGVPSRAAAEVTTEVRERLRGAFGSPQPSAERATPPRTTIRPEIEAEYRRRLAEEEKLD